MTASCATFATQIAKKGAVLTMEHIGCKAVLRRARRLMGEGVHGLPSGQPVPVFPLSALPGAPDNWVRDGGSYVCPVSPDWGLWFDWTCNDHYNTAVLPSVKGMNPITGQKIESLALEKYENKCPIHGIDFDHARFCSRCNYRWPAQNYVSYPNTLWWDGFRQPDGSVRQFFFTEDEKRDIASAVIGKENTVPAFGFAYYRTKVARVVEKVSERYGFHYNGGGAGCQGAQGSMGLMGSFEYSPIQTNYMCFTASSASVDMEPEVKTGGGVIFDKSYGRPRSARADRAVMRCASAAPSPSLSRPIAAKQVIMESPTEVKSVSVGAGAKIAQELADDVLKLDQWDDAEKGIIRLYFVFEPEFKNIFNNGGVRDLNGDAAGYLNGLPVG